MYEAKYNTILKNFALLVLCEFDVLLEFVSIIFCTCENGHPPGRSSVKDVSLLKVPKLFLACAPLKMFHELHATLHQINSNKQIWHEIQLMNNILL
jgi:hypothetical protein